MNFNQEQIGFDFVKHRNKYFIISLALILAGLIFLIAFGLNLSVDFEGGTRVEVMVEHEAFTASEINEVYTELGISPEETRISGNNNEIAVTLFPGALTQQDMTEIKQAFEAKYGSDISISEITVSPGIARELARSAIIAVILASIGITIYVTIRFEYRFALAAMITIFHDAFIVIALFSIMRLSIDLTFIAAILTVVGYSINDTIVVFDRIRENLKIGKVKTFEDLSQLVNKSIVDTLARSINTSLTVVFAAATLYLFGGESIRNFSFALLVGLVIGAYSSIFIAAQLWLVWKGKDLQKKAYQPAKEIE